MLIYRPPLQWEPLPAMNSAHSRVLVFSIAAALMGIGPAALFSREPTSRPIDFSRDVYPILKGSCFDCHGPQKQRGHLRLDAREAIVKAIKDKVIVPGKANESDLYRRVTLPKGS